MHDVAIIGAGELGGAVAHVLARRDCVRSIRLIDETGRAAAGKALDIAQAGPVEGFATQLTGSTDLSRAAGASVVVLADRLGGEWQGDEGWLLLEALVAVCGRGHRLRRRVPARARRSRRSRAALRTRTAVRIGAGSARRRGTRTGGAGGLGSPRDVALSVLGVPPHHTVIPWEDATMAGFALTRVLDEPTRRRLSARVSALWPPGPYALATAAAMVIEVMAGRSRRMASCFVAPEASAAARRRTGALPVRLGPSGIVEVLTPALSVVEQIALDNALMI